MNEIPPQHPVRLTRAALAFIEILEETGLPVFSDYQLFLELRKIFKNRKRLYLRGDAPSIDFYRRYRKLLIRANVIAPDPDYPGAYRLLSKPDLSADEVSCLIDPFCYISHLSAMQRYGLTDRRPEALHLTVPGPKIIKEFIHEKMEKDYGFALETFGGDFVHRLNVTHHPKEVRQRYIDVFSTIHYGDFLSIRGSHARISTIAQTFLDMVEEPSICGGMVHVMDVWKAHAGKYLQEIIYAIDNAPKSIHKVRAGYILEEILEVKNPEIDKWKIFAQRGGSRVLDPSKPFTNQYSEQWMISINV